jgi:capsular polysaccharide biosynthesis protein
MSNEPEIWGILKKFGFEKINPPIGQETLKTFNEATIVVGAHGAGLLSIFACQPQTKVIELTPLSHSYPYYISLSQACGFEHEIISSDTAERFHIDQKKLTESLIKNLNK